jgi:hypothetical protein
MIRVARGPLSRSFSSKQTVFKSIIIIKNFVNSWKKVLRKMFEHKFIHVSLQKSIKVRSVACGRGRCQNGRGFGVKWQWNLFGTWQHCFFEGPDDSGFINTSWGATSLLYSRLFVFCEIIIFFLLLRLPYFKLCSYHIGSSKPIYINFLTFFCKIIQITHKLAQVLLGFSLV